jgi:hypothetical protein
MKTFSLSLVPLRQFAHVQAARAEGFSLEQILVIEQLEPSIWQQAEPIWVEQITEQKSTLERYQHNLQVSEEQLGRRIVPIDYELEDWVQFLYVLGQSDDPNATLESIGLRLTDLSRLQRCWQKKFREDPKLAKKAAKLKDKKRKTELPKITCGVSKLCSSHSLCLSHSTLGLARRKQLES